MYSPFSRLRYSAPSTKIARWPSVRLAVIPKSNRIAAAIRSAIPREDPPAAKRVIKIATATQRMAKTVAGYVHPLTAAPPPLGAPHDPPPPTITERADPPSDLEA